MARSFQRGFLDVHGQFRSLQQFARTLERAGPAIEATHPEILNALGEAIRDRARDYLGIPQVSGHGGFPPWAPLAPSTLARKGVNTPLYETGALGESLDYEIVSDSEVQVGTDIVSERGAPYGKYLEEGTAEMPARPYLHPAAIEITEEMLDDIGNAIVGGIFGARGAFSVLRED